MKKAIRELLKLNIKNSNDLMIAKRKIAKKYGVGIIENSEILRHLENVGAIHELPLRKILRKRAVRTMSGIAPVAVLVKPFPCPGKCAYCPTEKDVPQSYLSNEPAVMRAIRCGYDPYKQVQLRLRALEANGHEPTKIEIIVIGGTWSVLPEKYKYWYIANLFAGVNKFSRKSKVKTRKLSLRLSVKKLKKELIKEQRKNEKAKYKIIGLTLETRPDYINEKELLEMRELGCTRVELGVQALDDKILTKNKRGHGVKEIVDATKLLRDFGFKITYHIMPGLPGSTAAKDLKMFKQLFSDERFQPDQIKFYPTVVMRGSLLYKWWRMGKYKPYSDEVLQRLIVGCKKAVPEYVRIIRLIRDIPGESIIAGNKTTNLRQVMWGRGVKCRCIRCREVRELRMSNVELRIIKYKASGGEEYFIQAESKDRKTLYGFCRLRLKGIANPSGVYDTLKASHGSRLRESKTLRFYKNRSVLDSILPTAINPPTPLLKGGGIAIIRELHVYGELVPVGNKKVIQHAGLGKRLMREAEKIARANGFKKIAVISGVGARDYYRKLGYKLRDNYMIKILPSFSSGSGGLSRKA
jgi:elongator complex protein 3